VHVTKESGSQSILLLLPCFYAVALAVKVLPDPDYYLLAKMLLLFVLGAIFGVRFSIE
jgi:hypothetical protein